MRLLGLVLAALLLAGCGSDPAPTPKKAATPTFVVSGHMDVDATGNGVLADTGRKGAGCAGQNGFDDMQEGAQVVVRDSDGKTVGVGQLEAGTMATGLYALNAHCTFPFTVPDVKSKSDFLSVEVSHRGQVQFKRTAAENLSLTLTGG